MRREQAEHYSCLTSSFVFGCQTSFHQATKTMSSSEGLLISLFAEENAYDNNTTTTVNWDPLFAGYDQGQGQGLRMDSNQSKIGGGDEVYYPLLKQPTHMVLVYSLAYCLVSATALVGNVMVMAVVVNKTSMHSVTNYFLFNLAVADLLVALFCVPVNLIANLYNGWQLGALMCKAAPYLQGVSVCASVNTLAAIALDRYFAICHTLEMKISKSKCKMILLFIWLTALGVMVPWLVFFQHQPYNTSRQSLYVCYDLWPSLTVQRGYYVGVMFVCCYSLPLTMITVCYGLIGLKVWRRHGLGVHNSSTKLIQRSKVKVLKMLVVVCVLFSLSWLPLYAINFWRVVQPEMSRPVQHVLSEIVVPLSQWLSSSNCCMNPIIYCFFSNKFRQGFWELVTCCRCRRNSEDCKESMVRFRDSPESGTRTTIIKNGSTRGGSIIVSV